MTIVKNTLLVYWSCLNKKLILQSYIVVFLLSGTWCVQFTYICSCALKCVYNYSVDCRVTSLSAIPSINSGLSMRRLEPSMTSLASDQSEARKFPTDQSQAEMMTPSLLANGIQQNVYRVSVTQGGEQQYSRNITPTANYQLSYPILSPVVPYWGSIIKSTCHNLTPSPSDQKRQQVDRQLYKIVNIKKQYSNSRSFPV